LVHPFQAKKGYGFVAQLSADGSTVLFASKTDGAHAVALDSSGNAFLAGSVFTGTSAAPQLLRIDPDVPSLVTVEEPQRLFPATFNHGYPDGIVPGEFLEITGSGIGPVQTNSSQLAPQGTFPATLSETTVTFDGLPAQLISVQPDRIVCIVPYSIGANPETTIMSVTSPSGTGNSVRMGIVPSAVSIIAAVNPDGSVHSYSHPIQPGSVLTLYANGFGQTVPQTIDGVSTSASARKFVIGPISANLSLKSAVDIEYIGSAPGQFSAVTQINIRIPSQLQPGTYYLEILSGQPTNPTYLSFLNVYVGKQ
jgi:uncharacterized protein (TIGR03437 family)